MNTLKKKKFKQPTLYHLKTNKQAKQNKNNNNNRTTETFPGPSGTGTTWLHDLTRTCPIPWQPKTAPLSQTLPQCAWVCPQQTDPQLSPPTLSLSLCATLQSDTMVNVFDSSHLQVEKLIPIQNPHSVRLHEYISNPAKTRSLCKSQRFV